MDRIFAVKEFEQEHTEATEVGIGQFTPLLHPKYTQIHWLLNINQLNPA